MLTHIFSHYKKVSFTNIRRAIITSFVLAALFAALLVICINFIINERENDVKVINLAGRQLLLGQKISEYIYFMDIDGPSRSEIKKEAELWDRNHSALRYGNPSLGITKPKSPKIDSLFAEISPYQHELYNSVLWKAAGKPVDFEYTVIQQSENRFLKGMGQIVNELQSEAEKEMAHLKYVVSFGLTLFVLFIFGLYKILVKPIIKMVRSLSHEREEQMQQSKSILENTSDLIWSLDRQLRLLTFNSAFSKVLKKKTGTFPKIGEHIPLTNFSKEKIKKWEELLDKVFSGKSFRTEFETRIKEKSVYYELSFNPIFDNQDMVNGCNIFCRDISDRMDTYQRLSKSEKSLKEAQEIANMGNWSWDMVHDEIQWSEHLYRIFGQDPETFTANYENLINIIHPDDRKAFDRDVENCIKNNGQHDIVHRIILENGRIRYLHQKGRVYRDEEDRAIRMAGTTQDVTQLEKVRIRNMQQYNELQNFVYIISHNVRAPISTLQSLVDIFEPDDMESNTELIAHIGTTVNTLDKTIKDLNHGLSLKRVSATNFAKIDLEEVLHDIERLLEQDINSTNAEIEYDFSKAPQAWGIKGYFTNILYNLILNSINYRAENRNPFIKISSRSTKAGTIVITVEDNGKGMALTEEKKKKIFNMYGRLSSSTNGTGMGLYLVKTQVETMNGTIAVESQPDTGTVFTMEFERRPTE